MDDFKQLVFDRLIESALQKLFSAVPVLGWGPLGWLTSYIVYRYAGMLYDEMERHVKLKKISFKNEKLESEFAKNQVRLKLVSRDHGPESKEYQEALNEAQKSMSNVIRFNVARNS